MGHQQHLRTQESAQNQRCTFGKPQIFLQLSFGVSWSDRHVPRTHTLTYTSENLKAAKETGHFPRPEPSCHQPRRRGSSLVQHRDGRQRVRPQMPSDHSHVVDARTTGERGGAALPFMFDGLMDDDETAPSATLFPRPVRIARNPPHLWKDLPASPRRFRLGEDAMPWSTANWPSGPVSDEDGNLTPVVAIPTMLPIAPPSPHPSMEDPQRVKDFQSLSTAMMTVVDDSVIEDPQRVKDLESLSTAMVTVDNGLDSPWWNESESEPMTREPPAYSEDYLNMRPMSVPDMVDMRPVSRSDIERIRPMSMDDAVSFSAADPYGSECDYAHDLISPLSDVGPSFFNAAPPSRSNTTRSEELWMRN